MQIHVSSAPRRTRPKAGDEKVLKGVTMIRQQERVPAGMMHAGAYIEKSGRPAWEWVAKCGPKDRRHASSQRISAQQGKGGVE